MIATFIPGNYEFMMKSLAFMVNMELSFDGEIALERLMIPFKHVHSPLTKQEIEYIAETLKMAESETEEDPRNPNIKIKKTSVTWAPLMRTLLRSCPEIAEAYDNVNQFSGKEKNKYDFGDDVSNVSSEIDLEEVAR